jgi:hypothetical protein
MLGCRAIGGAICLSLAGFIGIGGWIARCHVDADGKENHYPQQGIHGDSFRFVWMTINRYSIAPDYKAAYREWICPI